MARTPGTKSAASSHARPAHKLRGRVAHTTHGRVRLQFPATRNPEDLQPVVDTIRRLPSVHKIEVHPRTGSVIVHHSVRHAEFARHLRDLVRDSSLFLLETEEDAAAAAAHLTDVEHDAAYLVDHSRAGKAIVRYAEHLNRAVKYATDGWVDLRVLVPASAGVCALLFVEVESAPLWLPLALFSFQSFNNLHQPHPTGTQQARQEMAAVAQAPTLEAAASAPVTLSAAPDHRPAKQATKQASKQPAKRSSTKQAPAKRSGTTQPS